MSVEIKVPDVGEGVTHVTVTDWLKAVGDRVEAGELVVEVMTDKAAFEVTAPVTGVLVEICVPADTEVAVSTPLGRIDDDGAGAAP